MDLLPTFCRDIAGYKFCIVEHIMDVTGYKNIIFIGTYYEASRAGFTPSNLTLHLPAHPLLAPCPCDIARLFLDSTIDRGSCIVGFDSTRLYPAVLAALIWKGLPYPLARAEASRAGFSPVTLIQSERGRVVYALKRFGLVRECSKGCRIECCALFKLEFTAIGVQLEEDALEQVCYQLCNHVGRHVEGVRVYEHNGRLIVKVWAYGGRDASKDVPERIRKVLSDLTTVVDRDVEVVVEYRLWPPHYCSEVPCI